MLLEEFLVGVVEEFVAINLKDQAFCMNPKNEPLSQFLCFQEQMPCAVDLFHMEYEV